MVPLESALLSCKIENKASDKTHQSPPNRPFTVSVFMLLKGQDLTSCWGLERAAIARAPRRPTRPGLPVLARAPPSMLR
jgi:hypothetical protein